MIAIGGTMRGRLAAEQPGRGSYTTYAARRFGPSAGVSGHFGIRLSEFTGT